MTYTKTIWLDQVVQKPRTYTVVNNPDSTITLQDSFGTVTELGTPVNAANLNKIEDKLFELDGRTVDLSGLANTNLSNLSLATALTNLGFAGQSLSANGYYKLPNGLIMQWGTYGNTPSGTQNFPVAYPNSCFVVELTATNGTDQDIVTAKTNSSFSWANGGANTPNGYFMAFGY